MAKKKSKAKQASGGGHEDVVAKQKLSEVSDSDMIEDDSIESKQTQADLAGLDSVSKSAPLVSSTVEPTPSAAEESLLSFDDEPSSSLAAVNHDLLQLDFLSNTVLAESVAGGLQAEIVPQVISAPVNFPPMDSSLLMAFGGDDLAPAVPGEVMNSLQDDFGGAFANLQSQPIETAPRPVFDISRPLISFESGESAVQSPRVPAPHESEEDAQVLTDGGSDEKAAQEKVDDAATPSQLVQREELPAADEGSLHSGKANELAASAPLEQQSAIPEAAVDMPGKPSETEDGNTSTKAVNIEAADADATSQAFEDPDPELIDHIDNDLGVSMVTENPRSVFNKARAEQDASTITESEEAGNDTQPSASLDEVDADQTDSGNMVQADLNLSDAFSTDASGIAPSLHEEPIMEDVAREDKPDIAATTAVEAEEMLGQEGGLVLGAESEQFTEVEMEHEPVQGDSELAEDSTQPTKAEATDAQQVQESAGLPAESKADVAQQSESENINASIVEEVVEVDEDIEMPSARAQKDLLQPTSLPESQGPSEHVQPRPSPTPESFDDLDDAFPADSSKVEGPQSPRDDTEGGDDSSFVEIEHVSEQLETQHSDEAVSAQESVSEDAADKNSARKDEEGEFDDDFEDMDDGFPADDVKEHAPLAFPTSGNAQNKPLESGPISSSPRRLNEPRTPPPTAAGILLPSPRSVRFAEELVDEDKDEKTQESRTWAASFEDEEETDTSAVRDSLHPLNTARRASLEDDGFQDVPFSPTHDEPTSDTKAGSSSTNPSAASKVGRKTWMLGTASFGKAAPSGSRSVEPSPQPQAKNSQPGSAKEEQTTFLTGKEKKPPGSKAAQAAASGKKMLGKIIGSSDKKQTKGGSTALAQVEPLEEDEEMGLNELDFDEDASDIPPMAN